MAEQNPGGEGGAGPSPDAAVEDRNPEIPEVVLELDDVFEVLAHPRRRYLLYSLGSKEQWTLHELAARIAAWENDVPEESMWDDEMNRVYVTLFHSHVPKLVEKDVLEFDEDEEVISPGENAEQVLSVLEGAGASVDVRQEAHARGSDDE